MSPPPPTSTPGNQNPVEFRHMRSGSLNIPAPGGLRHAPMPTPGPGQGAAPQRFDAGRSPPNTSHVPCKFFRQGQCQAGNACPFSHDLSSASEIICKYFAKGNCKFGPKCANIHILPDGRRINYGKNGVTFGNLQPQVQGAPYASNLTNSFMAAHEVPSYDQPTQTYGGVFPDDDINTIVHQPSIDSGLPIIDTTHAYSHSGSPRDDMGLSPPINKGLSVMDAPLPASFDSNAMSNAALFPDGPFPASVPNQFGFNSPSPSLHNARDSRTSETLKMLHTSAFGHGSHLSPGSTGAAGSSPPSSEDVRRANMHSSRHTRPSLLSASMPKGVDRDWDPGFQFAEEDYLPDSLKDLLTPTEKARRGSLRAEDGDSLTAQPSQSHKFGSPIPTSSPSGRWGSTSGWTGGDGEDRSGKPRYGASPFGHVGSPLRNSSLIGSDLNSTAAGNSSRQPTSSHCGTGSNESLSVLTQRLQRTKLEAEGSLSGGSSPRLRPMNGNGNVRPLGSEKEKNSMERHVSSSSIGSGRLASRPIDEEEAGEFVFDMDEDVVSLNRSRKPGVTSGFSGWNYAGAAASGARPNAHLGSKREPGVIGR